MLTLIFFLALLSVRQVAEAQAEVEPWGNLSGIRVDGQLMHFETSLILMARQSVKATAKERQHPAYHRTGEVQVIDSRIDSLFFREAVRDSGRGVAVVTLDLKATADMDVTGVYYSFSLPPDLFLGGTVTIDRRPAQSLNGGAGTLSAYLQQPAHTILFKGTDQTLVIHFPEPAMLTILPAKTSGPTIRFATALQTGSLTAGQQVHRSFVLEAGGKVDHAPVTLVIAPGHRGRAFAGFGGNFRLQNPRFDPEVIDYCLTHMRVAWGRVEMPWSQWQPAIDTNPVTAARAGNLHPHVRASMELARRLYKMGMPVILTAWFPPAWAVMGPLKMQPGADGIWGNALDQSKTEAIYASIADYIQYLKDAYGVEVTDFSFNESDLGINVRQTAEEHDKLIRELGAYFEKRGFKTKLLLGDNSDANSYSFIIPALHDSAAHRYIGAVSFHSWRGWDSSTLQHWADATTTLKLPLLIGEGSIDAAAWAYPAIFQEQTYALKEIGLYMKLLRICEPASILQWQLTSDYSPMAGGGMAGDNGPLRPTQRFWNMKQLASVPDNLSAIGIRCPSADIEAAALGANGKYSVHLVNSAAARPVTVEGFPAALKSLHLVVTDQTRAMEQQKDIPLKNGSAVFNLPATCYATLYN
jgi:hypothetical protein